MRDTIVWDAVHAEIGLAKSAAVARPQNSARTCAQGVCAKPSTSKMPFKQMENVASYLNACKELGVAPFEMFMTVDLFENKNMQAVLVNLQSVGRIAQSLPGYSGPAFGAKVATAKTRVSRPWFRMAQFASRRLL